MKKFLSKRSMVVTLIIFLLVILFATNQFVNANSLIDFFPTATITPGDLVASGIDSVRKQLSNPNLSPETRKKLEERLQIFYRQQTFVKTVSTKDFQKFQKTPNGTGGNQTPNPNSGTILTGIIDEPFILPDKSVVIENAWQNLIDGEYITIYAGHKKKDLEQGVVCFQSERTPLTCIDAPVKSGSMRVVEQKDKETKLILKSKNAEVFFFDIRGKKFTKSLDEIVPTATLQDQGDPKANSTPATPTTLPYP